MQPHGNRPVYIIQQNPSVRPVSSLQPQRFATSPQQIFTTNVSPHVITPHNITRLPTVTIQPTMTTTRPTVQNMITPQAATPTAASPAPAAAAGSKEYAVRVPRGEAQYGIMEFASGIAIDLKDGNTIEMRREINPFTYRPATNTDPNAASSSNTITTSLGGVLPKTGAGSEYGREQKEALKRKRYATKGTNLDDLPWQLTNHLVSEKKVKHFRGMKKGGIASNSSYYVFIQGKEGFEAYPVNDWYGFTPTNVFKPLGYDEAEKQYDERSKTLSKWFNNHKVVKEKDPEDDGEDEDGKGKKSGGGKRKNDFKLLDTDEWDQGQDEDEDDDEDNDADDDKDKKGSKKKKTGKKSKKSTGTNLSDDDEDDETERGTAKKKKKSSSTNENGEQGEDSDNGDHDQDEVDYTSDETSEEEDDARDANTVKSSAKYEVKGIDEEMKSRPDIAKKLEQMDDNDGEIDFDDDDSIPDVEDNDDDNDKGAGADDLSDVSKLLKNEAISKEIDSSSEDDDSDDSDDPDKETIEPIASSVNTQPIPSEQIKTEKGHKKAREEEMRAIKSTVMSLPSSSSASSNPTDTITEEKVRALLSQRHHMTFTELIQKFLPKPDNLRTKEVKDGIVKKLADILKRVGIEEKTINGKKHIKLK